MIDKIFLRKQLENFLFEDIGYRDITTDNLDINKNIYGKIISKDKGILAGVDFAVEVFKILDDKIQVKFKLEDGEILDKNKEILVLYGDGKSLLKGERLALNILQRLSGIATLTSKYVEKIKDLDVKLLDTRKTTPGFRIFEKYAVKVGGGDNHRLALYDMVMIKDNHIKLVGSIREAVNLIKSKVSPMVKIEVEVSSLKELEEALQSDVDIVMLDNMSIEDMKEAVRIVNKRVLLEASGNVNINNIRDIALTGVDFISTGALIHSSRWLDLSMRFE